MDTTGSVCGTDSPRDRAVRAIVAALDALMPDEACRGDTDLCPLVEAAETALKIKLPIFSVKIVCTRIGTVERP